MRYSTLAVLTAISLGPVLVHGGSSEPARRSMAVPTQIVGAAGTVGSGGDVGGAGGDVGTGTGGITGTGGLTGAGGTDGRGGHRHDDGRRRELGPGSDVVTYGRHLACASQAGIY